jgi:hypothetical protein
MKAACGSGCECSSLVDWPVYPRLAHTMNDAQCGLTRHSIAAPPRHTLRKTAPVANPKHGVLAASPQRLLRVGDDLVASCGCWSRRRCNVPPEPSQSGLGLQIAATMT